MTDNEYFDDWMYDNIDDLKEHFIEANEERWEQFLKVEFNNHLEHMETFKEDMARRYK